MHIAVDIQETNRTGGMEKVCSGLANAMAARGHQVTCFTCTREHTLSRFPFAAEIRFHYYPFTGDKTTIPALRDAVLSADPDLFISISSFNNVLLWCGVLHGTPIPLLYSEHSNPWIIEKERWNKAERRAVLWAADAVHLLMPRFLDSVPPMLRDKCRSIGNAAPMPSVSPRKPHAPCVLSLGRLAPVKQIPLLVRAFSLLAGDFPCWELHIWGAGEDEGAVRAEITRSNCIERIYLHGQTRDPESQFAQADIFCIPSRYEGFGLTVVEAFSNGVPVVGFQECSAVNTLIQSGSNGLLAPEMTSESLARSLRQLMENADLRQRMGTAARKTSMAYAPQRIYDQWEELIRFTASRKGRTRLAALDSKALSAEEEVWKATMRTLLARKNLLLRDSQILRRLLRRHPRIKILIKQLLRKNFSF